MRYHWKRRRGMTLRQRIYNLLAKSGPMAPRDIAGELDASSRSVSTSLGVLRRRGVVRHVDEKRAWASRWEAVPGSTEPVDMRGQLLTSRRNLLRGNERFTYVRKYAKKVHALEQAWGWGVER